MEAPTICFPTICFASPSQLPRRPGAQTFSEGIFHFVAIKSGASFSETYLLENGYYQYHSLSVCACDICIHMFSTKHSEAVNTVIDYRLTGTFKMGYSNILNL